MGGGISTYAEHSTTRSNNNSVTISGNTISGNSAPDGGGIHTMGQSLVTINNHTITENSAPSGTGVGVYCRELDSNSSVFDNLFSNNISSNTENSSTFSFSSSSGFTFTGNTFTNNETIYELSSGIPNSEALDANNNYWGASLSLWILIVTISLGISSVRKPYFERSKYQMVTYNVISEDHG